LAHPPCPLCGAVEHTVVAERAGGLRVPVTNVICQACGFLHRQEPWGAEEAAEFYRKASREYDRIYGYDRLHGEYVQKVQAAQARRRVRWLAEWAPAGARVLDVGCGNGAFVAAAREAGYAAEGMELDEAAVAEAQGRGLPVRLASFEAYDAAPGSFAALGMFDVLEHAGDLRGFLARARELLAPEGVLLVEVPEASTVHMPPVHFLQPEHNWHFTTRTLRHLLTSAGWRVEQEAIVPWPHNPADAAAVVARKMPPEAVAVERTGPEEHDRVLEAFARAQRARLPLSAALRDALIRTLGLRLGVLIYRPVIAVYVGLKKLLGLYREPPVE